MTVRQMTSRLQEVLGTIIKFVLSYFATHFSFLTTTQRFENLSLEKCYKYDSGTNDQVDSKQYLAQS